MENKGGQSAEALVWFSQLLVKKHALLEVGRFRVRTTGQRLVAHELTVIGGPAPIGNAKNLPNFDSGRVLCLGFHPAPGYAKLSIHTSLMFADW